jgi:hypothetical protein
MAAIEPVKPYNNINVQEDFKYHAALILQTHMHIVHISTSGRAGIGSRLNMLSDFPSNDFDRTT